MPRLAVIQLKCAVGNIQANIAKARRLLQEAAEQGADIACLPECFNTGMAAEEMVEIAEQVPGRTSDALCDQALKSGLWIVAGIAEKTPSVLHNTALVISPGGEIVAKYRKCYLYLQEAELFTRGAHACVVDMGFALAGITICYDYVFPEYMRDLVMRGARILVHSTAWVDTDACRAWHYPAALAYRAQAMVRALENGVFFMSANHCGAYDADGHLQGVGHSAIIAPWGQVLAELKQDEGVAVADVDFSLIDRWASTAAPYLRDFQEVPKPL